MNANDAMSPRMKAKFSRYVPRIRHPHEALPPSISVFKLKPYTPEAVQSVRPGADDHKRLQSRGVLT